MARNRSAIDREQKRIEILDAATDLLLADGYDATSMSALAAAVGVAPNTVYWYFDDKDAVLVAVLAREIERATERYASEGPRTLLADRLMWVVSVFDRLESLISTLHARAEVSEAVRTWHEGFHRQSDLWLQEEIRAHWTAAGRPRTDPGSLAALAHVWSFTIEGMIAHHLPPAERRAICEQLVRQVGAA